MQKNFKLNLILVLLIISNIATLIFGVIMNRGIREVNSNIVYREVFDMLPGPAFIKDRNSVILDINNEYKEMLLSMGITEDFVGTKGEVFGGKAVEKFIKHDAMVISRGDLMKFQETIPGYGTGISYKVPIKNKLGFTIGTFGIWIIDKKY